MMFLCIRVGVRDAVLEIWQADNQGNYDPADTPMYQQINYDYTNVNANPNGYNCRARVRSDQDGKFSFNTSESFTIYNLQFNLQFNFSDRSMISWGVSTLEFGQIFA